MEKIIFCGLFTFIEAASKQHKEHLKNMFSSSNDSKPKTPFVANNSQEIEDLGSVVYLAALALFIITLFFVRRAWLFYKTGHSKKRYSEAGDTEHSELLEAASSAINSFSDSLSVPPVYNHGASAILTSNLSSSLRQMLPSRFFVKEWKLLYSNVVDGTSLNTFYRRTANQGPTVSIIQDSNDFIFGVFIAESWKKSGTHFGNGETFVFQLQPITAQFHWSEKNDYFAYGKGDSLAVGGGNNFAIWIDENLIKGTSDSCETFQSPTLSSHSSFIINRIEVWGFD